VEQREAMIAAQLSERRELQRALRETRQAAAQDAQALRQDVAFYLELRREPEDAGDTAVWRSGRRDAEPSLSR
jgi:hypothetical protein